MSGKNAECTIVKFVIIIVISNSYAPMLFCPMKTRIGQKRGEKGPKGKEERSRKRDVECCPPGYQEQRDARSQTYEEAIVREHFAPVTSARQWPPLTRPVTVSLFVDNA